jgi:hypothetical protein
VSGRESGGSHIITLRGGAERLLLFADILSMRYLTTGCWISSLRLELLSYRGNNVWDNKLKTSTIKRVTKVGVTVGVKNLSS